jgi:hypothetical protein
MTTTMKTLAILMATAAFSGPACAGAGKVEREPAAARPAAWERVGENNVNGPATAQQVRAQAPGEEGLQARKADMVRRMFWIMIAHR